MSTISRIHEAYNLLKNNYTMTCNNCEKPINAVEFAAGGHQCSKGKGEMADLKMVCKKCGELIWDKYKYTEIGEYHLNNNNNCKE